MKLIHGVTCGTNLTVDFIATAHTRDIETVENGLEPEWVARRMRRIFVVAP